MENKEMTQETESCFSSSHFIAAMDTTELNYENPRDVLPKDAYQELDNQIVGQLLRTLRLAKK